MSTAVCTDSSGNVYAVGCFYGSVDFDPGIGEHILTTVGDADAFLCKYDPDGNFLWAVSWGSSDFDNALAVAAFGDSVYVTGMYFGTIDLDPDPDAADIWPCMDIADAYVSKFNSSGAYQWGKAFGGTGVDTGLGIVVGHSEAFVEVAGRFGDTVDFDSSGGVDNHASNGLCDCFLTRLTPSGEYVWTQTWGGTADDLATAVAVDANDNTYVTSSYRSTVDFDPSISVDSRTSAGDSDVFLTRRDSSGVYVWTLAWGGSGSEVGTSLAGGKAFNEVWVTGGFTGTVDFDPTVGVDNRTSNGANDVFLCGFNSAGTRYFTDTWGGPGADYGYGITYRSDDILFVTGEFRDEVDFDPGAGILTRTSNGEVDAFFAALTWNGYLQWAETWGGPGYDRGLSVACLDVSPKAIFVGGLFMGTVDFNPGPGVDLHSAAGTHEDAFVSRFPEDGQW